MNHPYWTGFFRGSLNTFEDDDGDFLLNLMKEQQANPASYPLTDRDRRQLVRRKRVRTLDREVEVEVPDHEDENSSMAPETTEPAHIPESRESIRYQAKVAQIGAEMGFHIWVPRNDKARVLELVPVPLHDSFLEILPLNYDDTTLRTVEQIDVLWLRGRSMARAFEIEHTTAIYSGLLRMADLLALQPNMNIHLHIVAPLDKRERVCARSDGRCSLYWTQAPFTNSARSCHTIQSIRWRRHSTSPHERLYHRGIRGVCGGLAMRGRTCLQCPNWSSGPMCACQSAVLHQGCGR